MTNLDAVIGPLLTAGPFGVVYLLLRYGNELGIRRAATTTSVMAKLEADNERLRSAVDTEELESARLRRLLHDAQEYVSVLRRQLLDHGIDPEPFTATSDTRGI